MDTQTLADLVTGTICSGLWTAMFLVITVVLGLSFRRGSREADEGSPEYVWGAEPPSIFPTVMVGGMTLVFLVFTCMAGAAAIQGRVQAEAPPPMVAAVVGPASTVPAEGGDFTWLLITLMVVCYLLAVAAFVQFIRIRRRLAREAEAERLATGRLGTVIGPRRDDPAMMTGSRLLGEPLPEEPPEDNGPPTDPGGPSVTEARLAEARATRERELVEVAEEAQEAGVAPQLFVARRQRSQWWRRLGWGLAVVLLMLVCGGGFSYMQWGNLLRGGPSAPAELTLEEQMVIQLNDAARVENPGILKEDLPCPRGWSSKCIAAWHAWRDQEEAAARFAAKDFSQIGGSYWILLSDSKYIQRSVALFGDLEQRRLLLLNRNLREDVAKEWWYAGAPRELLTHPALSEQSLREIYGAATTTGEVESLMPYLVTNPNLDPQTRGLWLLNPASDPTVRRDRIRLVLSQPAVPTGIVGLLLEEAVKAADSGDLSLWDVLVEAAEAGDIRASLVEEDEHDFLAKMQEAEDTSMALDGVGDYAGRLERARAKCQYEFGAGRHSPQVIANQPKVAQKVVVPASPTPPAPVESEFNFQEMFNAWNPILPLGTQNATEPAATDPATSTP